MKNFLLSILLIPIFSFSQEFTIQELNSGEDFIFKGRNQLHKIIFTKNKDEYLDSDEDAFNKYGKSVSEGVVLDLNNKTLLRVIKTDFKYTLIDNLDSNYQWVFYKNEGKIGRLQNNRSIGILEDILKPDEYLPSENNVNEESNNVNNFFLPSPYFGFEPDSKKFEILKKYRQYESKSGNTWFDNVGSKDEGIGNGNYTITIEGKNPYVIEIFTLYVSDEDKVLLTSETLEKGYSYSSTTIESRFDSKIANLFDISKPTKKFIDETLKIDLPEGIKINIHVVSGYLFELSNTETKQNFSRYIGYTQSLDTIRNRKGQIRTIKKGKKRGFTIDVPQQNVRSSNSKNDIEGTYIGAGFYDSYKNSDIDKYLNPDLDDFRMGKAIIESIGGDVIFGVVDADVPEDYIKSFFSIYMNFFDLQTNPLADVTFTSLDGATIAIALGMNDDCVGNIAIDIDKWNKATNLEKYFIMFHELGHDIFNLSHSDGIRLMATNQFNIKNEFELGEMLFEMFYYVEKMDFKHNCSTGPQFSGN